MLQDEWKGGGGEMLSGKCAESDCWCYPLKLNLFDSWVWIMRLEKVLLGTRRTFQPRSSLATM